METISVFNTLTKKEEPLMVEGDDISFYHCGPTVYWRQHIGNMRGMVMGDLIRRSLMYLGYTVTYVRNYTDVGHLESDHDRGDDKMSIAAKRESLAPEKVAEKYILQFEQDAAELNILPPTHAPRATTHIGEITTFVQKLLDEGYAYTTAHAVYFDTSKKDDYTKLSGQKLEEQQAGAGTGDVTDTDKRNPADFALWFFKTGTHKHALQTWPSPFDSPASDVSAGEGFPGWHIECSAMAEKYLGKTVDIHMGGIEHIPIHHTNEIAQSETVHNAPLAHYWLHNEHLTVDGKKMAKSEGTSYTVADIAKKGFDPLALRYFFLGAHYRSKQNFTFEALEGAHNALTKLKNRLSAFPEGNEKPHPSYTTRFKTFLGADFDIPQALALVWDLLKDDEVSDAQKRATILDFDRVFGLNLAHARQADVPEEIQTLLKRRESARQDEDWEKADDLRKEIESEGFTLEDTEDGPRVHKH